MRRSSLLLAAALLLPVACRSGPLDPEPTGRDPESSRMITDGFDPHDPPHWPDSTRIVFPVVPFDSPALVDP